MDKELWKSTLDWDGLAFVLMMSGLILTLTLSVSDLVMTLAEGQRKYVGEYNYHDDILSFLSFTLQMGQIEPRNVYDSRCSQLPSGSESAFRITAGFCSFMDNRVNACLESPNVFAGVVCGKYTHS